MSLRLLLSLAVATSAAALLAAPHGTVPPLHGARARPLRSVATSPSLGTAVGPKPTGYDQWADTLDYKQFRKEVHGLGTRLANEQGEADVKHLKRMIMWSNGYGLLGLATMWMSSPLGRFVSILGLSTWTCTRWTMIGHHISHGGYNRQDDPKKGGSGRFTTYGFAVGSVYRRARDWFDWMLPEAWNVEHNNLHHYRLSESGDPDLVERNLELMRDFPVPRWLKYVGVGFLAAMWKWYYYAPNTYKQLKISEMRKAGMTVAEEDAHQAYTLPVALFDVKEAKKYDTSPLDFIRKCMGPYLLLRFFLLPSPLLVLSPAFYWAAVGNLALADVLSNIHSFIIIATNHCGEDMYATTRPSPRASSHELP